jgi:hypothetical protein
MPVLNTQGAFNIGRDITVVLQSPSGKVQLTNITKFDCKQETDTVKVKRIDGTVLNDELEWGWTGSIELERGDQAVDLFFANKEATWLVSGISQVSQLFTYIVETDGSTSTFAFDNVALKLSDAGSWSSDAAVKLKIDFIANRRRSV